MWCKFSGSVRKMYLTLRLLHHRTDEGKILILQKYQVTRLGPTVIHIQPHKNRTGQILKYNLHNLYFLNIDQQFYKFLTPDDIIYYSQRGLIPTVMIDFYKHRLHLQWIKLLEWIPFTKTIPEYKRTVNW
jgi:hypothetical protein